MIPAHVVCGFLGAGKTSFLLNAIRKAPGRIVALVNEFGSLGIDGERIRLDGTAIEVPELPGGCICCTQKANLIESVLEMTMKLTPDALWVEPSGIASASELVAVFEDQPLCDVLRLEGVFCVIDASTFEEFSEDFPPFFANQVEQADVILLNKTDLVGTDELVEMENRLQMINSTASIHRTLYGRVDLESVVHTAKHAAPSSEIAICFETMSVVPQRVLTKPELDELIDKIASGFFGKILRAKGFLTVDGEPLFVNYASGGVSLERVNGAPRVKMVLIGMELKREAIDEFLRGRAIIQ